VTCMCIYIYTQMWPNTHPERPECIEIPPPVNILRWDGLLYRNFCFTTSSTLSFHWVSNNRWTTTFWDSWLGPSQPVKPLDFVLLCFFSNVLFVFLFSPWCPLPLAGPPWTPRPLEKRWYSKGMLKVIRWSRL
jgi:hypothetical protein